MAVAAVKYPKRKPLKVSSEAERELDLAQADQRELAAICADNADIDGDELMLELQVIVEKDRAKQRKIPG